MGMMHDHFILEVNMHMPCATCVTMRSAQHLPRPSGEAEPAVQLNLEGIMAPTRWHLELR